MLFTVSLRQNRDFRRAYARGRTSARPLLALYARKNYGGQNRLGITVGAKVGGAVQRNRVRRRIKELYRRNESMFKSGFDLVVVARVRAHGAPFDLLRRDFLSLMQSLDLLLPSSANTGAQAPKAATRPPAPRQPGGQAARDGSCPTAKAVGSQPSPAPSGQARREPEGEKG